MLGPLSLARIAIEKLYVFSQSLRVVAQASPTLHNSVAVLSEALQRVVTVLLPWLHLVARVANEKWVLLPVSECSLPAADALQVLA